MRFLSLLLAFSLMIPASHASTEGLSRAFNELDYKLNVDSRATDPAHREAAQAQFAAEVRDLKAQGLTNQDLIAFAVARTPNRQAAAQLEQALTTIDVQNLSTGAALELVQPILARPQGAAYLGDVLLGGALLVVIIIAVVALVNDDGGSDEPREEDQCNDYGYSWAFITNPFCIYGH